jgi:hypothetical protein
MPTRSGCPNSQNVIILRTSSESAANGHCGNGPVGLDCLEPKLVCARLLPPDATIGERQFCVLAGECPIRVYYG